MSDHFIAFLSGVGTGIGFTLLFFVLVYFPLLRLRDHD